MKSIFTQWFVYVERSSTLLWMSNFLICRDTISVDYAASDRITSLLTFIPRVTLNGIDRTIFAFLHDPCVVDCSISLPVKEDEITCCQLIIPTLPLSIVPKPIHTIWTKGIFRYDSAFQIAALFGTPRYNAGTPFHTAIKTVPRPPYSCIITALISSTYSGIPCWLAYWRINGS